MLHDLGKYSNSFQEYLRQVALHQGTPEEGPKRGKVDHSTAGAQKIWQTLTNKGVQQQIVGEILALCIASHHSGLIDTITPSGEDNFSRRINKADSRSHFSEACGSAEQTIIDRSSRYLQDPGLVGSLCKIAADICKCNLNETTRRFQIGLLVRFLFSPTVAYAAALSWA